VASLEEGVSSLEGGVSSLEGGVSSLEGGNLVVLNYLITSKIWPDKRGVLS